MSVEYFKGKLNLELNIYWLICKDVMEGDQGVSLD
jgi:hypothetical protein